MRSIKSKKPWRRLRPVGYGRENMDSDIVTQADFLREYYPTSHRINSTLFYPNIYREIKTPIENEDGSVSYKTRYYEEEIPRFSFAFQQIIAIKQIVHLCGNDVQFDLLNKESESDKSVLEAFRDGWQEKDLELAFYELAKSVKTTGDGAIAAYLENGEYSWLSLSFLKGDRLYPHYDHRGKLSLFARAFTDYDEQGENLQNFVEVWDNTNYYLLQDKDGAIATFERQGLELDGYEIVKQHPHGFQRVPIAYHRDDNGACWSMSQRSIELYEESFSQMAQNNKAFGEPILYFKGDNIDCVPNVNGTLKMITMGNEDSAGYLPGQSASDSYQKQLDLTYKMIYEQSFAVIPPELKSGDLPAAALKILYSPAYEKAVIDCADFQNALSDMVEMFAYGYGLEKKMTIDFANIPLKWWLKPYVHVNWSTTVSDLAQAVNSGFISKETASERLSEYATPKEFARILAEKQREVAESIEAELEKAKRQQEISPKSSPSNSEPQP